MILIDVGAAKEILPRFSGIKNKTLIAFEPDPVAFKDLQKKYSSKNYIIINDALSSKEQELEINFTKKGECSSIYKPNFELLKEFPFSERFDVKTKAKIKTKTIDNVLKMHGLKYPNYMKLDIQGAELEALKGSINSLKSICCIELEIEFAELYENQPLFSETEQFLRKKGFEVWDIRRVYQKREGSVFYGYKKGRLVSGDALFFKNPNRLLADLKNLKQAEKEKILLNSAEIAKVYGYSDYIEKLHILISEIPTDKLFYDREWMFKKLNAGLEGKLSVYSRKNRLTTDSMFSEVRYKFSKFLSTKLSSIAERINPYDSSFKTGDSRLGNRKIK